jgi:hypothetical protein
MAPKPARGLVPEPLAPERLQGGVRACWTSHLELDADSARCAIPESSLEELSASGVMIIARKE